MITKKVIRGRADLSDCQRTAPTLFRLGTNSYISYSLHQGGPYWCPCGSWAFPLHTYTHYPNPHTIVQAGYELTTHRTNNRRISYSLHKWCSMLMSWWIMGLSTPHTHTTPSPIMLFTGILSEKPLCIFSTDTYVNKNLDTLASYIRCICLITSEDSWQQLKLLVLLIKA